eukprot:TRINITY_DN43662_c0_g1_i1.p1 TRINITY_DN43662_c0_g1~~TRINITY_DN43662_c0_g1_i1.p1  ORF type:complete len:669 (-),score=113.73 TRINITY_DN43662_c0_g1_i1:166-2028(-)
MPTLRNPATVRTPGGLRILQQHGQHGSHFAQAHATSEARQHGPKIPQTLAPVQAPSPAQATPHNGQNILSKHAPAKAMPLAQATPSGAGQLEQYVAQYAVAKSPLTVRATSQAAGGAGQHGQHVSQHAAAQAKLKAQEISASAARRAGQHGQRVSQHAPPKAMLETPFLIQFSSQQAVARTNMYYQEWLDFEDQSLAEERHAAEIRTTFIQAVHKSFPGCIPADIKLLDCGCGIGRDLKAFKDMGYYCEGFDPCLQIAAKARIRSGQNVHVADFGSISLPTRFHGAFCLASLYHVPRFQLSDALHNLNKHLETNGVLLVTMPPGEQDVLHSEGCWVNNMSPEESINVIEAAGFLVELPARNVEIFGYESTMLVARKAEGKRNRTGTCSTTDSDHKASESESETGVGSTATLESISAYSCCTAQAYADSVQAFAAMAANQPGAPSARNLFLQAVHAGFPECMPAQLRLLDAGCGSGRDLESFKRIGYACEGFDPCDNFVKAATAASCCTVHCCHFENLDLPQRFHGIFCMASLYHVPRSRLVASLQNLSRHLVQGGALLVTIPRGPPYLDRQEPDGRWINFMAAEDVIKHINLVSDLSILHLVDDFKIYSGSWILAIAQKK